MELSRNESIDTIKKKTLVMQTLNISNIAFMLLLVTGDVARDGYFIYEGIVLDPFIFIILSLGIISLLCSSINRKVEEDRAINTKVIQFLLNFIIVLIFMFNMVNLYEVLSLVK